MDNKKKSFSLKGTSLLIQSMVCPIGRRDQMKKNQIKNFLWKYPSDHFLPRNWVSQAMISQTSCIKILSVLICLWHVTAFFEVPHDAGILTSPELLIDFDQRKSPDPLSCVEESPQGLKECPNHKQTCKYTSHCMLQWFYAQRWEYVSGNKTREITLLLHSRWSANIWLDWLL